MKGLLLAGPILAGWTAVAFLPAGFSAEKASKPVAVRYNRDIRPILSNRCFKCHGPDLKKGGLDLQGRTSALQELKSGHAAIVPGKSGDSPLLHRILSHNPKERMPPKGEALTPDQVAKLRVWIDQGCAV